MRKYVYKAVEQTPKAGKRGVEFVDAVCTDQLLQVSDSAIQQ